MATFGTLGFQGESRHVKDSENIRYIVHLLNNPGSEMHVFDLVRAVKRIDPDHRAGVYTNMSEEELENEGMGKHRLANGGHSISKADAKRARELLAELNRARADEDPLEIQEVTV